ADRRIERAFQRPGVQTNSGLERFFGAVGVLGDPGSVVVSAALYFSGLGLHSRKLAALGMYTGESVVLGGLLAEGLKGEVGRARPRISPDDSRVFSAGRGFSSDDYGSFPSAETTAAFAMTTALSRGINRAWPGHSHWVTPFAYTSATLVGASRLYKNEHWASDIVAAGGLGTFAGIFVDRFNQRYPDNIFERVFLPESIVPLRHGFAAAWAHSL
ncbi:MAG: phosphatase PAP2 family protein, partial [Gemmatimonadota bacterium]|nr:phosphatase PAP2 family protein [Gemmatimonadota bacterium]